MLFGSRFVFSFTEPSSTPPLSNTSAPLNISSTGQSKAGGLILNTGGATNGLIVQSGNVGIGTQNPGYVLDVIGYVRGSSGLCINTDCRTSWPSSSETDPTVTSSVKDGVSGSELTGSVPVGNSNFGGMFTYANASNGATGNYCSYANPYTGGCSCPGGFSSYQMMQLVGAADFYQSLDYRQQVYVCLR